MRKFEVNLKKDVFVPVVKAMGFTLGVYVRVGLFIRFFDFLSFNMYGFNNYWKFD